ncbi:hypothetical protein [Pseudoxanthomonas mexicana]|uniref:hypothetical protein n=1 Tax=Pseudoxanthomonas mexicana TaxID=128785 RepID=UPI00398A69B3
MNRNNKQSLLYQARDSVRGVFNRSRGAVAAGLTAMLAAPMAMAGGGGSLGSEVLTKLGSLESDVQAILLVLVGVVALFILYSFIKRAK